MTLLPVFSLKHLPSYFQFSPVSFIHGTFIPIAALSVSSFFQHPFSFTSSQFLSKEESRFNLPYSSTMRASSFPITRQYSTLQKRIDSLKSTFPNKILEKYGEIRAVEITRPPKYISNFEFSSKTPLLEKHHFLKTSFSLPPLSLHTDFPLSFSNVLPLQLSPGVSSEDFSKISHLPSWKIHSSLHNTFSIPDPEEEAISLITTEFHIPLTEIPTHMAEEDIPQTEEEPLHFYFQSLTNVQRKHPNIMKQLEQKRFTFIFYYLQDLIERAPSIFLEKRPCKDSYNFSFSTRLRREMNKDPHLKKFKAFNDDNSFSEEEVEKALTFLYEKGLIHTNHLDRMLAGRLEPEDDYLFGNRPVLTRSSRPHEEMADF